MRSRTLGGGLLALALVLTAGACGGGSEKATTTTEAPTTTTTIPVMPADFDWWAPAPTPLGHGWTVNACKDRTPPTSRGKVLCLDNKDGRQAILEHFRFLAPTDGNLNHHAAQFVEDFLKDRKAGCGEAYRVEAEPIIALDLPDGTAKKYGFKGGSSGAPDTERTVQWAGIRGQVLVILTITGYDPGSCVTNPAQGTLDDLTEILPGLSALVQAAGLPPLKP